MSHLTYNLRFSHHQTSEGLRARILPHLRFREYCFDDDEGGLFVEDINGRIRIEHLDGEKWILHFTGAYSQHLFQLLTSLDSDESLDGLSPKEIETEIIETLDQPEPTPIDPLPLVSDLTPAQQRLLKQIEEMSEGACVWIPVRELQYRQLATIRALEDAGFIHFNELSAAVRLADDDTQSPPDFESDR